MENNISELLVATVNPIVPISLNWADGSSLPYAVYEIIESEMRSKSGIYGYKGDVTMYIVDSDHSSMRELLDKVKEALNSLSDSGVEVIITSSTDASNESGQWANKMELTIRN